MLHTKIENEYEPVTVIVYIKDKDIMLKEVSLLAYNENSQKIEAVGEEAKKWLEYTDIKENIMVECPLKQGTIANYLVAVKMFEYFVYKALGRKKKSYFFKPKIAFCTSKELTQVEQKAFSDMFYNIGAKKILIVEQSFESAINIIPSEYQIIVGITENKL